MAHQEKSVAVEPEASPSWGNSVDDTMKREDRIMRCYVGMFLWGQLIAGRREFRVELAPEDA